MIFDTYYMKKQMYSAGAVLVNFDMCYPVVHGESYADRLNTFTRLFIERNIETYSQKVYAEALKQYKVLVRYNSFTRFEIKNNFNIMFSNNNVFSVFWDFYIDKGAAGYEMQRYSHNILLDNNQILNLGCIFARNRDWKLALIKHMRKEVKIFEKEMGISCFAGWENVLSRSIDDNRYYITDNGIVIYCPQGSVAPNIWGIPSFLAPFSELDYLLDKKFVETLQ